MKNKFNVMPNSEVNIKSLSDCKHCENDVCYNAKSLNIGRKIYKMSGLLCDKCKYYEKSTQID